MSSGLGGPPASFHYEYSDDWATWVLENGLPALPNVLGEDDEVPVAYWAGPVYGAVLFKSWWTAGEDERVSREDEKDVNNDHYSYVRTEVGWEAVGSGGGTAGPEDDPMRPRSHPDRLAYFWGGWQDGPVRGLTGGVGAAARTIELSDRHGVSRRPVDAPLGLVLVCFDALDEATVRVLDADENVLLQTTLSPNRW